MAYINKFCWCGRVKDLVALGPDAWLEHMKKEYPKVDSRPLTPQQIRAWKNSYDVITDAFCDLGQEYKKLHIIFEYCLPAYPPNKKGQVSDFAIRADAIVVSRDMVLVLEFKDRDLFHGHAFVARKYRTRLQRYHDSSWGMRKWAVLVPTLSSGIRKKEIKSTTACSPDRLSEEIVARFGPSPISCPAIARWRESSYSIHKPTPPKATAPSLKVAVTSQKKRFRKSTSAE